MDEFKRLLEEDLLLFNKKFQKVLSKKASLLYKVTKYIRTNSGKKIRPICCILGSGLLGAVTEKTIRGAILIELIHTATLIHDDIVDDAQIRRSVFSINTIWKNKIAVLTGDYFLAKGLRIALINKDYDILHCISNVVEKMVEGELMQLEKTKQLNLTESDYFKIINLKTGSLFECAFEIGTISSNADKKTCEKVIKLGTLIGRLFQIKDDILDYSNQKLIGKNTGIDIKEGKINLPLLQALKKMSVIDKGRVFNILRKKRKTINEINFVQDLVIKYDGINYAQSIIDRDYHHALNILTGFNDGKYKNAIYLLLKFLVERIK